MTQSLLEPLNDDQQALIEIIGRPILTGRPLDSLGWPVWDFVRRKFERSFGADAGPVLASLPTLPRTARTLDGPYGLWWRVGHSNTSLALSERVGLTIPGLHHLGVGLGGPGSPLPNPVAVILGILDRAAKEEAALDSDDWWLMTRRSVDLRSMLGSRDDSPVEIIGAVLQHEYDPLVVGMNQFNYELQLGEGRFIPFDGVADVSGYLARLQLPLDAGSVDLPDSPLALPAVLDYLGRILCDQPGWGKDRRLVRVRDFMSAAVVTQPPANAADYEQRLSALWTIICQFDVPSVDPARYQARGWSGQQSSINNLVIWLDDHVEDFASTDQCTTAIKTIRKIGTLRQGAQHSSSTTRANALRAQTELGLPVVITDYPAAWASLLDKLAGAFYSICLGITLQPEAADAGATS